MFNVLNIVSKQEAMDDSGSPASPQRAWSSHSPSLGVTALSALITNGTALTFTSHFFPLGISQDSHDPSSRYYYHLGCHFLLFFNHHNVWLVSHHHLISLDMEVPQDLCSVILNHVWRCLPFWPWGFQSILGADVPVHYAYHLIVEIHVCCVCLHVTPCCDVSDNRLRYLISWSVTFKIS